jgi:hypothetical protein
MLNSTRMLTLSTLVLAVAAATTGCGGGDASPAQSAQTITFNSPGNQTLGVAPAALSATASSGLDVSFTSTTTGVCTVAGNVLTLVSAGDCTITANQTGNGSFSAAASVARTFSILAAPTSLVFASGYTDTDADGVTFARAGRSVEGGGFNWYQDASANDWNNFWWNGISPLTEATPSFYFGLGFASSTNVPFIGAYVLAPNDGSVILDRQSKMRIAVWGNDELTSRGVPTFTVFAQLKQEFAGCYVEVAAPVITPAGIGAQTYELPLADFTIKNNCAGSGVTTAAEALAMPIGAVHVQVLKENMYFNGTDLSANGINFGPVSFEP